MIEQETIYLKGEDIAKARAAGGSFVGIDVNGTDYVIPVGFMEANGVEVQIIREPSSQKADGTIALAGESYHNRIQFMRASTGTILESAIPYLPGCRSCKVWDQDSIDDACARAINRWRIELKRLGEQEATRQRIDAQRARMQEVRQKTVQTYAEARTVRVDTLKVGRRLATLDDHKEWTLAIVTIAGTAVIAYPNRDTQRVIPNDTLVLPITHQTELEIKRLLGSIKSQ